MSRLRPVRGTHDLFGEALRRHRYVAETGRRVALRYAFDEIETPIFEFTEIFARTLGETSDVVTKEMYTFEDRGGDSITLRPENTASIVRAVVSCGLLQDLPVKFFYYGPMFRYERPQKGRLRQFHQIGIEIIGAPEPEADIEAIAIGRHVLEELGVADRTELLLNSLGNAASRAAYREALVAFLRGHEHRLSPESRLRLERNPLRILDSKDLGDREVLEGAPLFSDYLDADSRAFFLRVREGLEALGIPYRIEPKLVRGLDYYTHTAFEFVTGELGAQGAVLAGGRYDGLMQQMGGPDVAGIGWAAGVERLAMLLPVAPAAPRPTAIVPIGAEAERAAWQLAFELRREGFIIELSYRGRPGQRMKRADRRHCRFALSIGELELERSVVRLRDLDSGEEREVARGSLAETLRRLGAAVA
jgi:histidyl-tRNA synthetase